MNITLTILREAAARILGRANENADKLRAKESAEVKAAAREHSHLYDGYWKERYREEALQNAARSVHDALHGDDGGEEK